MNRRAFLGLGATLVGVGALQRSGAFSAVDASRGVRIGTAADSNALVGIVGNDDPAVTPTTTNNSTYSMTVTLESATVEFDVTDDGDFEEPATFDLEPEETREFEVDGDDGPVTIVAEFTSGGTDVGSAVLERSFVIPQTAAIREVVGSVKSAGDSGKYEFSLTNESGEPVTLDGFGVESTSPEATQVGGKSQDDILVDDNSTQLIDDVMPVGGGIFDVIDGQEVTLSPSVDEAFEFDRFRDDSDGNFGVTDVDLALRAADGSTVVVELRET